MKKQETPAVHLEAKAAKSKETATCDSYMVTVRAWRPAASNMTDQREEEEKTR